MRPAQIVLVLFWLLCIHTPKLFCANVEYDHRALVIDGKRRVLISGSIHYPRSTPERVMSQMWPDLIQKSKDGGLDVIETYVFWNLHEPVRGQYDFDGRKDLVKFVKTVAAAGLYVHLRIGPYVCAEWNYGGFPVWLHFIPGIKFRTDNEPFKAEMKRFTAKIVDMIKQEKLYASQGGPVILSQIENEYGNIDTAYGAAGKSYIKWAATMATSLDTGVPWVMCLQADAPDPIYHGGTNFDRASGGPFIATSYDYDAPIDEYGIIRQPKWGHLKEVHKAIKLCEEALIATDPTITSLGPNLEAAVYKTGSVCAAFLANVGTKSDVTVNFSGNSYHLPAWSVSILPDCKSVVLNTAKGDASSQTVLHIESLGHALHAFINGKLAGSQPGNSGKYKFTVDIPVTLVAGKNTIDLLSLTVGLQNYGAFFDTWGVGITGPVILKGLANGNTLDLSSQKWTYQVGLKGEDLGLSSGSSGQWNLQSTFPKNQPLTWYKTTFSAPSGSDPVAIDFTGMGKGEAWVNGQRIGRYWPTYVASDASCTDSCNYRGPYSASKCRKNCEKPSQTLYHVPRSWLKPSGNILVLFEERGGDPTQISIVTKQTESLCAHVSDSHPPPVDLWNSETESGRKVGPVLSLTCPHDNQVISSIKFASYGTPLGTCGNFYHGRCSSNKALSIVQKACIGSSSCSVGVSSDTFGDPCRGMAKSLAVEATCA
ncbi:hypothetical protein JHK82_034195 [Glycine max]|nr:hypothetical protein JHK82_034195 [Glycine max]